MYSAIENPYFLGTFELILLGHKCSMDFLSFEQLAVSKAIHSLEQNGAMSRALEFF